MLERIAIRGFSKSVSHVYEISSPRLPTSSVGITTKTYDLLCSRVGVAKNRWLQETIFPRELFSSKNKQPKVQNSLQLNVSLDDKRLETNTGLWLINATGGVKSTMKLCDTVATLPATSVAVISILCKPSLKPSPFHDAWEQLAGLFSVSNITTQVQVTSSLLIQSIVMFSLLLDGLLTKVITGGVMSMVSNVQND